MIGMQTAIPATAEGFDENGYLEANPDVAIAVREGRNDSGRYHFDIIGHTENRKMVNRVKIISAKARKRSVFRKHIQWDYDPPMLSNGGVNCLPDYLAEIAGVEHTDAISQHDYLDTIKSLIGAEPDKLFLDAGAGFRPTYYDNVVNLEIVPYTTTDVLGVLERIPFVDNTFDYVLSNAVLEHVRDPFSAAREITRVLKPGGRMFIQVPFLQPYHGYPHHYYNMTRSGVLNLFKEVDVISHSVPSYFHPVWVANWFFNSWAHGLTPQTRERFEQMTVGEFMNFQVEDMAQSFVRELSVEKQFELASGTYLIAEKKGRA